MAASRRQWGWHGLDQAWADRLVADARVPAGALVLDIGAGDGALIQPLLAAGARVIAVEAHPGRAQQLRDRFGSDIVVVQTDAGDLRLPRRGFHVVASLPYNATSAVLRRVLHRGSRLLTAHLIVQEQAARRWASLDAPAARRWQVTFAPSLGRRVPRSAFRPPPRVPSRILVIARRHRR